MSANELLHEIEALPDNERQWLLEELQNKYQEEWAKFSATQLAASFGPDDSIYDKE